MNVLYIYQQILAHKRNKMRFITLVFIELTKVRIFEFLMNWYSVSQMLVMDYLLSGLEVIFEVQFLISKTCSFRFVASFCNWLSEVILLEASWNVSSVVFLFKTLQTGSIFVIVSRQFLREPLFWVILFFKKDGMMSFLWSPECYVLSWWIKKLFYV